MMDYGIDLLSSSVTRAQVGGSWHMHDGGYMFGSTWGWGAGLIHAALWLLVLAIIVTTALVIARNFSGRGSTNNEPKSALDLLDERYANGEIDREEYLQRKKDILDR